MIKNIGDNFSYLLVDRKNNKIYQKDNILFNLNQINFNKDLIEEKENIKSKEIQKRNKLTKEFEENVKKFLHYQNYKYNKIIEHNYYTSKYKYQNYVIYYVYERNFYLEFKKNKNINYFSDKNGGYKKIDNFSNNKALDDDIRIILLFEID